MAGKRRERQGMILYFEHLQEARAALEDGELARLMSALLDYAAEGEEPQEMERETAIFYRLMKRAIDRDAQKYEQTCERNRERARKRRAAGTADSAQDGEREDGEEADGTQEEEREEADGAQETQDGKQREQREQREACDAAHTKAAAANRTKPNGTKPNQTKPNRTRAPAGGRGSPAYGRRGTTGHGGVKGDEYSIPWL